MRIGVPKEIKTDEYRVGLTPAAVREYKAAGHTVLVETGAGLATGAADDDYVAAGATISETAAEVFAGAELIVKVKEPQRAEWRHLRRTHMLFCYLHLAADPDQADALMKSGCTAIAYETVTDDEGALPLLRPMSQVAGRLAIEAACAALRRNVGGRGLLLGGVPGVAPARVVVIGGGTVGANAVRMAVGLGAEASVIDRSIPRLVEIDEIYRGRVRTRCSTAAAVEEEVFAADVVIGAVLIPGARAPRLITRPMLSHMKRGAVLVDVAIDQGGCFETSRPTTYADPTYVIDGVVHYCVTNMPGAVPMTASHALNNATLPYGLMLASKGLGTLAEHPGLRAGVNVHDGRITSPAVAGALGRECWPIERALSG